MENFKPQKMVGWFNVQQLANTGIRAILSSVFGSYADKRETLASLNGMQIHDEYGSSEEMWIDYISDTGDGFNSTFTMAKLIAEDELILKVSNQEKQLPRAKVVIFGGDQVYPTPSRELYKNRFLGPMNAASPWKDGAKEADLFAVPGNHDWYDGLNNFVKIFCQNRWIGSWKTKQNRSYFAIQISHNTWIWAIDIQLEADIDQYQLEYFDLVSEQMKQDDKVILLTAEPSWVYNTSKREDKTYENLAFFERKYIQKKGFSQILTMAGDLHHYARFEQKQKEGKTLHKITAGGGGAFMHPTHNIPDKLTNMRDGDFDLKQTFPSKKESRNMAFKDLLFSFYNGSFGLFLAVIHMLFAWSIETASSFDSEPGNIFTDLHQLGLKEGYKVFGRLLTTFSHSPIAILILVIFLVGFYKFCDVNSTKRKFIGLIGALHGALHICIMILSIWFFTYFNYFVLHIDGEFYETLALLIESFFIGGGLAGTLTGIYLLISNLVFGIHDNEAFSALKIEGYKNFLRMHVKDNQLTIYPIGVRNTPKWKKENGKFVANHKTEIELIEEPIIINLN